MTSPACSAGALSATTMSAPSLAKATAIPAPIPDAAPVTTATRPSSLPTSSPLAIAPGGVPHCGDRRTTRHVEPMAHQEHRRIVLLLVIAADAVVRDHDVVVAEHRIPRRRLHTALR